MLIRVHWRLTGFRSFPALLERVPHAQLHDPRRHGRLKFPELPRVVDIQYGIVQIDVIERIEGLAS